MSITIQCQCSRVMTVSEELAGQPTRCPSCGRRHLVPKVRREPRAAELSGHICRECRTHVVRDAEFCHSCGLPTGQPQTVTVAEPPRPQPQPQQQAAPAPPQTAPQPQPQMQGPFGPQMQGPFANQPIPPALLQQLHPDGPFAKAIRKANRPVSGLAKVSMTCAYISIVLAMFTALAAVPMVGFLQGHNDMQIVQAAKLQSLVRGMGLLVGLFAFTGVFTGFLGLFHFNRKRGGAVLGLILSFLIGAATVGGVCKLHKRYIHKVKQMDPQSQTIEQQCPYHSLRDGHDCWGHDGCDFSHCDRDEQDVEGADLQPADDGGAQDAQEDADPFADPLRDDSSEGPGREY